MAFRYPTGARPLLVEETARRRRIESRFVAILEAAGFAEVVLPIIDFAEPYTGVADRDARSSYRFVDRDGELVAIRSDFTPMVARALAPSIEARELPLRVFYRGDVIRCETTRLGANRELFQIGAELIGDGSVDADLEILRLVSAIAKELIGAPKIVHTLRNAGVPPAGPQASSPAPSRVAARDAATSAGADAGVPLIFHQSDEPCGYYTGFRFWLYGNGRRAPFAQGGRYDSLYGRFGNAAPAVGFTFTIDDLED